MWLQDLNHLCCVQQQYTVYCMCLRLSVSAAETIRCVTTAPCDDNVTASTGARKIELAFADLPAAWLGITTHQDEHTDTVMLESGGRSIGRAASSGVSCELFDIFATANKGKALGTATDKWSVVVPPHGVRFLRLSNCSTDDNV
jgi:hypothetical protein